MGRNIDRDIGRDTDRDIGRYIGRDIGRFVPSKGIRIPVCDFESGNIFLVECWILDFGIRNATQGIRNLTIGIQNPISTDKRLESSTCQPESTTWNLESSTVLDSLTWGEPLYKGCRIFSVLLFLFLL